MATTVFFVWEFQKTERPGAQSMGCRSRTWLKFNTTHHRYRINSFIHHCLPLLFIAFATPSKKRPYQGISCFLFHSFLGNNTVSLIVLKASNSVTLVLAVALFGPVLSDGYEPTQYFPAEFALKFATGNIFPHRWRWAPLKDQTKLFYSTPFPLFPLFKCLISSLALENKPMVARWKCGEGSIKNLGLTDTQYYI